MVAEDEPTDGQRSVTRAMPGTVSSTLRPLLLITLLLFAFLAASGYLLSGARLLGWLMGGPALGPRGLWLFLGHVIAGCLALLPLGWFVIGHWAAARQHPNRAAIRRGRWLVAAAGGILLSGLALVQVEGLPQLPAGGLGRTLTLLLHALLPVLAVVAYLAHRRAGPAIRWSQLRSYAAAAGLATAGCLLAGGLPAGLTVPSPAASAHLVDSTQPPSRFWPAATRTVNDQTIAAESLMNDDYCLRCHQDAYQSWFHSAHHFSSFNNPAYLASVRETRAVLERRDGSATAVRWCGGCHDPVPLLSGRLDDPGFDDRADPAAHAGITCTICHAVTDVHTLAGNGGYTIAAPEHYPFTDAESELLQWLNGQLIRAKPDFHRQSFLKPLHRSAEFCGSCHKVSIPPELNHYKDFLRGQNHYDSFLLSGVSGHGARSFYYPATASENCNVCHMPLTPSDDPAAEFFPGATVASVHNHLFPAANTALPTMLAAAAEQPEESQGFEAAAAAHAAFLRGTQPSGLDRKLRIDIFGLKEGGRTDGVLQAPIRPELPTLTPGETYLIEVVVRTLAVGHHFTQGTVDSNEVWVEFTAADSRGPFAASGLVEQPEANGPVDPDAARLAATVIDRNGKRIDRRNVQDIFTAAVNHEIPPGAAEVIHYQLQLPAELTGAVTLSARVRYRKFDSGYIGFIEQQLAGDRPAALPSMPIVDLCEDSVILPLHVDGGRGEPVASQRSPIEPAWQRWNDYGIGCLLEGDFQGKQGELKQAEAAFQQVTAVPAGAAHGWINLVRVFLQEGRLPEAVAAVNAAAAATPPAPWWQLAWFGGVVAAENAATPRDLDRAIGDFEKILDPANQPRSRGFDFSRDYVVRNRLADTLFKEAITATGPARQQLLLRAARHYETTRQADPENLTAHYGLAQCHARLADNAASTVAEQARAIAEEPFRPDGRRLLRLFALRDQLAKAAETRPMSAVEHAGLAAIHRAIHSLLRPDEQAMATAVSTLRANDPAADRAAEVVPIYPLKPISRPEAGATASTPRGLAVTESPALIAGAARQ